jgi:multiple antibiotic resistance protein
MDDFTRSFLLLFVLLNPFILSVYMRELVNELDFGAFSSHLLRAALISLSVFLVFAWGGDMIFEDVLQVRFHAFMIFGGITFLIIGTRLILGQGPSVVGLKPHGEDVSAAIAMPLIVGPGTISASVLAGSRLRAGPAAIAVTLALAAAMVAILLFKGLHDYVRSRNERVVRSYAEIAGRVTALFTGSFAIEMILTGIDGWLSGRGSGSG